MDTTHTPAQAHPDHTLSVQRPGTEAKDGPTTLSVEPKATLFVIRTLIPSSAVTKTDKGGSESDLMPRDMSLPPARP